jgi:hypothetical protein
MNKLYFLRLFSAMNILMKSFLVAENDILRIEATHTEKYWSMGALVFCQSGIMVWT